MFYMYPGAQWIKYNYIQLIAKQHAFIIWYKSTNYYID